MSIKHEEHKWTLQEFEAYHRSLTTQMEKYPLIPHAQQVALVQHIIYGRPTGSFLQAVLSNDFMKAVNRADDENQHALAEYGKFLYNHAPLGSYGSETLVTEWKNKKGMFHFVEPEAQKEHQ